MREKSTLRLELKAGIIIFLIIFIVCLSKDVSLLGSFKKALAGFVIILVWIVIIRLVLEWLSKGKGE